jgi:hypothetical protein
MGSAGPTTREKSSHPERWLFGPAADLLLGCGVGYVAFTALLLMPGATQPFAPWASLAFVTAILALFTNTPHYGATLLRVYEHRGDRRRYALFGLHATLLIFGLFIGGLYWAHLGSLLLTLYITWSPWHFAGQNYGLATMFLRRRGVPLDTTTKRLLYASFVLSFLVTFFALHGGSGRLDLAPVPGEASVHYAFLSLGIPEGLSHAALWICGSIYIGVLVILAGRLLSRARIRELGPTAMLVLLQALWFSVPALLVLRDEATLWKLTFSTIWISIFHSIQYLWVTSYYARQNGEHSKSKYLGKTVLAGAGVMMLPALLFAPGLLGTIPFDAGLGALLFATINIHHFMLDGAIWKLRDGPVARALLRAEAAQPDPIAAQSSLPSRVIWTLCAVAIALYLVSAWEFEFGARQASAQAGFARQEKAITRLRWIGRESHIVHYNLGFDLVRDGQLEPARVHLERSIALYPTARAWTALGNLERLEGHFEIAVIALDAGITLDPNYAIAHKRRGEALASLGKFDAGLAALREAERLDPDNQNIRDSIERVTEWRATRRQP